MRLLPIRLAAMGMAVALALGTAAPATAQHPATHENAGGKTVNDGAVELLAAATAARQLGDYRFAIHALKQAHDIAPDNAHFLSIAKAYRQAYRRDRRAYDLTQALAYYDSYWRAARADERTARIAQTRLQLEAAVRAVVVDDDAMAHAAAAEMRQTRLAITSQALGAVARIDGGKPRALPLFATIAPGKHRLVVSARGYETKKRKLTAVRGHVHAIPVTLAPKPARLTIAAPAGAAIFVDGDRVGMTPLDEPLELEPGAHRIAVTMTGYHAYRKRMDLERGKSASIEVDLPITQQRIGAATLLGGGSLGLAMGVVFGVVAVVDHRAAANLRSGALGPLDASRQVEHDALIARRDDFRVGSAVAAGFGLGLFLVGGALFILDEPVVPGPDEQTSLTWAPTLSPTHAGGSLLLRF